MLLCHPAPAKVTLKLKYYHTSRHLSPDTWGVEAADEPGWYMVTREIENGDIAKFGDVIDTIEEMGVEGTVNIACHLRLNAEHMKIGSIKGTKKNLSSNFSYVQIDPENADVIRPKIVVEVSQQKQHGLSEFWGHFHRPNYNPDPQSEESKRWRQIWRRHTNGGSKEE